MTQLYWNIWITLRNFDVNDSKSIGFPKYHENTRLNNNSTPCICKFAKVQIIIFTQL